MIALRLDKKDMIERPRKIDVVRKLRKCPICGERVVDIRRRPAEVIKFVKGE